jgi:hypothetical protein
MTLNIVYDLLQTTKLSSKAIENNESVKPTNKIYFVICNSCYWCASYFSVNNSYVLNCYACSSPNTELIPIGTDESFKIDFSHTRGMEIEFYKNNK